MSRAADRARQIAQGNAHRYLFDRFDDGGEVDDQPGPFTVSEPVRPAGYRAIEPVARTLVEQNINRIAAPGRVLQGQQPQTPGQWSDVDEATAQANIAGAHSWGAGQAMGMVGTPGGAGGHGSGVRLAPEAKLEQLRQQVPGLEHVLKYMEPDEIAKVKKQNAQTLVDLFQNLPAAEEMAAVAYSGRAKRGWYRNSANTLVNVFGMPDSRRFAALLAATSPQSSVESNAINSLNIWNNWVKAGRPTDRNSIIKVMGESVQGEKGAESILPAWINNTVSALSHEDPGSLVLSGPKVNSFAHNLRGLVNEVTNDAWMANYAGVDQELFRKTGPAPGKGPGYIAMSARARQAAEVLSQRTGEKWTPAEVQETVWSWAKALYEKTKLPEQTMQDIVKAGGLTHEEIAGTPDFETLFANNIYAKLLQEGGYGSKIPHGGGSRTHGRPALTGSATTFQGSGFPEADFGKNLEAAAARLDALRAKRKAEAGRAEGGAVDQALRVARQHAFDHFQDGGEVADDQWYATDQQQPDVPVGGSIGQAIQGAVDWWRWP